MLRKGCVPMIRRSKGFLVVVALICLAVCFGLAAKASATAKSGEALFKENCSVCHPDGGNIVNPQKTLHKKDRDANNVKTAEDIIKKMRNPGPGMTKFDEKTIGQKEALEIANYIIKTFNK